MQRRPIYLIALVAGAIVLAAGWYLFRPELLFIDRTVDEQLPGTAAPASTTRADAVILSSGSFQGLAHQTKGVASIYRLPGGKRILRFTEFETSNGPDVRVYLVRAPDAKENETVQRAGFIDLGAMKGNRGSQNYDLPAEADLSKYQSVSIWCRRFGVNFGAASLKSRTAKTG